MRPWLIVTLLALTGARTFAQEPASARDAYLEAWFQETAEADLAEAVRLYRQVVEMAGAGDAELAARASWRIARIARARGDEAAARAQLEQVVERYPDSEAAARAREDLAAADTDGPAKEEAAVEAARRLLIDMLEGRSTVTSAKARTVFANLSAGEIVAVQRQIGGSLSRIIDTLGDPGSEETVFGLMRQGEADLLRYFRNPAWSLPDGMLQWARESGASGELLNVLVARGRPEDFARAVELVEWLPEDVPRHMDLLVLASQATAAEAAGLVDALLPRVRRNVPSSDWHQLKGAHWDTPAGARLQQFVSEMPVDGRWRLLQEFGSQAPPALLLMFFTDPEPRIRHVAIQQALQSSDPDLRQAAFERLTQEPAPLPVELVRAAASHVENALELPAGPLREALYWFLLTQGRRDPVEVIAEGIAAGDVEVVDALLAPRWWRHPELTTYGGTRPEAVQGAARSAANSLSTSFAASPSAASVLEELALLVRARPEVEIRTEFLALLESVQVPDSRVAAVAPFVQDEAASVRLQLAKSVLFAHLPEDARLRLLLDDDPHVAAAALAQRLDPSMLGAAIRETPIARLEPLVQVALRDFVAPALRIALERLPHGHPLARSVFAALAENDAELAIAGTARDDLRLDAVRRLRQLTLPEDVVRLLSDRHPSPAELHQGLTEHAAEIREALRQERITELLHSLESAQSRDASPAHLGRRLAALQAKDEAIRLIREGNQSAMSAGGYALAALGETERLRAEVAQASDPYPLVPAALEAGLGDDLLALATSGVLDQDVLFGLFARHARPALAAALLLPPGIDRSLESARFSVAPIVAHLVAEHDADGLARVARLYDSEAAVRALLRLEAYERILKELPEWARPAAEVAAAELARRTGIPAAGARVWPEFRLEQTERIEEWRRALGL